MHIEVVLFFSECRPLATPIEVSRRCEYSAPLKNQATFKCLTSYSSVLKCHPVFIRPECSVGCSLHVVIRSYFCLGGVVFAWRSGERGWGTFLSPGRSSSPLSLLRDSEGHKTWSVLFGLYFFGVFVLLWRVFARDVGLNCLDIAVPAFSNQHFQLYFWQSTAPALKNWC